MLKIGDYNTLKVIKTVDFGVYLDGKTYGEILLPTRYVPADVAEDEELTVFIYNDSEDRLIATTEQPKAKTEDFALLEVVSVNRFGAFLDWGLPKDLLVPYAEQRYKPVTGELYLVYIYLDQETGRIVASGKIDKFLDKAPVNYCKGDEVEAFITSKNNIGYRVLVNNHVWGMIYHDEVFQPVKRGSRLTAWVKKVRDDNKVDLTLQKPGYEAVEDFSDILLEYLKKQGGKISITDKSDPERIKNTFNVSKKVFKKAVGKLFKNQQIVIEENQIKLT